MRESEVNRNMIEDMFGINVFNKETMRKVLRRETFDKIMKTIENGDMLNVQVADEVANAMKEWAISKGATHYAHWFQPLNGLTAEKHDSFIEISNGKAITNLLGTELIKSEPDASSFPSGGLRATFEARGYTSWDVTSPVFVKEGTLYIPSVFYSYNGAVLDQKTPLLKAEEILSDYAVKVLRLLGNNDVNRVISNVGAEQEYFLVDKDLYDKRKDLFFTGRTLFGLIPARGQEADAHYFGTIKERVAKFMKELDIELWKLGIPAKTKHNEVAPAQHELAVIYTEVNISTDNNQLIMELMKKIALRHNLVCLLHEKPFSGINGSGKHNNWSLQTDTGINLFSPGREPENNIEFLLFIAAVIRGVDKYSTLLSASIASLSNDLRLGGNEAPPSIVSIFLGDKLLNVFKNINQKVDNESSEMLEINLGVHRIQKFMKDTEDRNRTSPFAFTGNKFEFRMLGSSMNISSSNVILMLMMIDSLNFIYEKLKSSDEPIKKAYKIVSELFEEHNRIIFNGDGYSKEWISEAKKRKLPMKKNAVEAFKAYVDEGNIELFTKYEILSKEELESKYEILKEDYDATLLIEAKIMCEMVIREIIPAVIKYMNELANSITLINKISDDILPNAQINMLRCMNGKLEELKSKTDELVIIIKTNEGKNEKVIEMMNDIRVVSDSLEEVIPKSLWPFPTYEELLYRI